MTLRSRETILCCGLAAGIFCGCRKEAAPSPAADPSQVIATYAGGQFLRGEVAADLERRLGKDPAVAAPERRREALRAILMQRCRTEMHYRDAVEKGIPERPDVRALIDSDQERLLAADWLDRHVAAGVYADPARIDEEVARRSQGLPEETRSFSHIFLKAPEPDAPARQRARATMDEIRKQLADGKAFEDLAKAYSDSITARGGGKVEWTARKPLHPLAAKVVFALSEGQVSEPLETDSGVHLFRLDGIRRPAVPDPGALRQEVKRLLDDEARRAAIGGERSRAFDQSGVRLDSKALSPSAPPDAVVALVGKDPIRRRELDVLRGSSPAYGGLSLADLARALVVDRILAARRRDERIDPALQQNLDRARRLRAVEALRQELLAAIPQEVTPREESDFYARNRDTLSFLREYVLDFVFFTQEGPSAVEVYAAGESVSRRLREGESFEKVLDSLARRPATVVRKRLAGVQMEAVRRENSRIAKAMALLPVGEVSRALYLEGKPVTLGQKSLLISGKGLIFLRIVETRPFSLDAMRDQVREAIRTERRRQGIANAQRELDERAALKILEPEG